VHREHVVRRVAGDVRALADVRAGIITSDELLEKLLSHVELRLRDTGRDPVRVVYVLFVLAISNDKPEFQCR
jgi:hypothetical protein